MRGVGGEGSSRDRKPRAVRKGIALAVACLLILAAFFVVRGGPPRSDEEQIRDLITTGKSAVEAHNLPTVMGLISKDYKDSFGFNRDRLRILLGQTFRDQADTTVNVSALQISVSRASATAAGATEATAQMTASISSRSRASGDLHSGDYPITLHLKKEPGYRFLVLPQEKWRVVSASGTGFGIDSSLFELF